MKPSLTGELVDADQVMMLEGNTTRVLAGGASGEKGLQVEGLRDALGNTLDS